MRLIPTDPDVETIYSRISNGDLNLQPNFQRGEVWGPAKRQKLIDSILRQWHVPPIHVIQSVDGGEDEVLDGQQRLVSIRDFIGGKFRINGLVEPFDEKIFALNNLRFQDLSQEWRRKFLRFPIRIFNIVDFSPSEPSELFFRLNQPASLTAAEQRNSFFGEPREQIKNLVMTMEKLGVNKEFLGFSNSRMAYDDVLARACVTLENGLGAKISANLLADRYRSGVPFDGRSYKRLASTLNVFSNIRDTVHLRSKLNKAGLLSWMIFLCRFEESSNNTNIGLFAMFFEEFESRRSDFSADKKNNFIDYLASRLFEIYNDRVTSRVADVSSVVLRDVCLWGLFLIHREVRVNSLGSVKLSNLHCFLIEHEKKKYLPEESELLEFAFEKNVMWETI